MAIDVTEADRWFGRVRREFPKLVAPFADKPIVYVEIGVWAAAASAYVCRNVLTNPDSVAYGIDPYNQAIERRRYNVSEIKEYAASRVFGIIGDRYKWIYEPSETGLLRLKDLLDGRKIDLLYIDGLHLAPDVLSDFVLAWPMLQNGSRVIFDDHAEMRPHVWPHVRHACAAIELAYRYHIKPIHLRRQYALDVVHHETPVPKNQYKAPDVEYPEIAITRLIETSELYATTTRDALQTATDPATGRGV